MVIPSFLEDYIFLILLGHAICENVHQKRNYVG
jgi:hypothetical protein